MEQFRKILNYILIGTGALALLFFFVLPILQISTSVLGQAFSSSLKGFNRIGDAEFGYTLGVILTFIGSLCLIGSGIYGIVKREPANMLGFISGLILIAGTIVSMVYIASNPGFKYVGAEVYVNLLLGIGAVVVSLVSKKRQ